MYRNAHIVFLISDFISFNDEINKTLMTVNQFAELIAMMVVDPMDMMIPEGLGNVLIKSPDERTLEFVDSNKAKEEYDKFNQLRFNELRKFFIMSGNDFCPIQTEKDFLPQFTEFLIRRESRFV